ncbi:MAG TPA: CHAT domain-containing protein, partial [Pirellulales bacterium]
ALEADLNERGTPGRELVTRQNLSGYHPGLLSGLVLAGANHPQAGGDDGYLTAEEVATLDLRGVELCVLSACETGLGEVAGGEGLLGLQRAFQEAGSRAVVASLWRVPDQATRHLMERFYTNLWDRQSRMTKIDALREAQLWMLREGASRGLSIDDAPSTSDKRLPPYYWAAFVLSGDWH